MATAPFGQRDVTYFYRRVEGFVPGGSTCHSQIELSGDGRWLLLRLASTVRFTVALSGSSARALLHALRTSGSAQIPVTHEDHGPRLLRVGPHATPEELPVIERGVCRTSGAPAMELALDLPQRQSLRLIFPPSRLRRLICELATAYLQLVHD
ncbi:hypothetical protein [Gandjariella thermophila]|uniref:Uncharacterized protein n=1 Tax=Gandjariella thermophila TaxID=1931992 RepID=A0A4D4JIM7_9PSEU|nr:hypothetical protein [Gandjariella thermophila]GDY33743.1 hypothetical protein GTS_53760 [Gandjariella thermophila]